MSTALAPAQGRSRDLPRPTSGLWEVASVRWATASLALFLAGLAVQLLGGPEWLRWTLYLVCYATGGWESAWAGLQALRNRSLDVDLLMIVAAVGAAAIGQVFDGALLIVIFATSGALEDVATKRTEDSVSSLLTLAPERATVVDEFGTETTVPADTLAPGDTIVVRPGERIGADGTVVDGSSDVDQSSITGEPLPAAKTRGDAVFAGTHNGTGALRVEVTHESSESVVARIVALVAEASESKARTQLFIEKVEQRYSVGVVVATLLLFSVPLALGADLESTLLRAMTFMIVASPCAVVLATMPPLLSSIANAGRHGVLVKSAVAMEKLADTTTVALDKTGTLTHGTPVVGAVVPIGTNSEDDLLRIAAAAEQSSEHPLGRAIVNAARMRNLPIGAAHDFFALPGRGVRAVVDGESVAVLKPAADSPHSNAVEDIEKSGATAVLVFVDDDAIGIIGLDDELRVDAGRAIAAMTTQTGTPPMLFTGDNGRAAAHVGGAAGIGEIHSDMLPADKAEKVARLQSDGTHRILMVGDGINDAPALAAAHTGVAMGRVGSDLALDTADVVIVRDELDAIPTVLALARRTRRIVQANLAIAATFIVVLVTWDLFWHLPLPLGVAGHEGSTILVALNGLRLLSNKAWQSATPD